MGWSSLGIPEGGWADPGSDVVRARPTDPVYLEVNDWQGPISPFYQGYQVWVGGG